VKSRCLTKWEAGELFSMAKMFRRVGSDLTVTPTGWLLVEAGMVINEGFGSYPPQGEVSRLIKLAGLLAGRSWEDIVEIDQTGRIEVA